MDKLITIYKASAGAGKTHTLTQEYIKLILKDDESYKHVLAVTFTNKATDEMKVRILTELYKMASDEMCADRERAKRVLIKILQDYPAFSVSTIDKFFQKVMRAFARELGRLVTYNVELDEKLVAEQAVDNMFANLESEENRQLLEWLIEYSLEMIEEEKSWRISKDIAALSMNLFSEKFKVKSGDMAKDHMSKILNLKQRIAAIISDFEKQNRDIAKKALSIMEGCELCYSDFTGASNSPFNIFNYLLKGERIGAPLKPNLYKVYNNVEAWYPAKRKKEAYKFENAYNGGLNECIGALIGLYEHHSRLYNTALCVKVNLNSLGILGSVYSHILEYCKENNVLLLSETTDMLSHIIDGSDTPFIYEKVGTWINNFMLDEFQDTSRMQWNNFLPLLSNSIANGERNLAVGDIKQCIYRFRNSDWSILHKGIESEFPGKVENIPLRENWRSASNIINFNNRFFESAAVEASIIYEPLGEEGTGSSMERARLIRQIYSNFSQKLSPRSKEGGYININFIDNGQLKENSSGDEAGITYDEVVKAHLIDNVKRLLDSGYSQSDIGILVRYNSEAALVARALMEADPTFRVISADSLSVSSSPVVMKIINILKWLDDPDNISIAVYSALEEGNVNDMQIDPSEWERMKGMPLYQMCEEIVRCTLTKEEKRDMAFIQTLLDLVLDYTVKEGSNLSGFVKWWDEGGKNKSISFPDGQDAFQVMTVHKSKGLDFEVVILPYFSERLDYATTRQPLLWSTAASGELDYEGPLPVKYSQKLRETHFAEDYLQEKLEVYIDNLNVAYVAFTRPRKELIIIAEEPQQTSKGVKMQSVANLLYKFVEGGYESTNGVSDESCLPGLDVKSLLKTVLVGECEFVTKEYTIGSPVPPEAKSGNEYEWFEAGEQFVLPLDTKRLGTSLQSGSINDDTTLRDKGIEMHDIFASVTYREDIAKIEDEQNRRLVEEMVASVNERGWFSDRYDVLKECTIINPDGSLLRPDRIMVKGAEAVVVDYKFGEFVPYNKKYHKQVHRYMQLLMDMGYTKVSGFLWYPLAHAVEEVR